MYEKHRGILGKMDNVPGRAYKLNWRKWGVRGES